MYVTKCKMPIWKGHILYGINYMNSRKGKTPGKFKDSCFKWEFAMRLAFAKYSNGIRKAGKHFIMSNIIT